MIHSEPRTEPFVVTPTAGHQLDVSSADQPSLVDGFAAHCDVLRRVEDHVAPHLADFTRAVVGHVGVDAQLLRLWDQRLPHSRLVAAPKAGEEPEQLHRRVKIMDGSMHVCSQPPSVSCETLQRVLGRT